MSKNKLKEVFGKVWYFIWEDDSILSWIVNIILAFVLIKFIVYPGLGFILGTGYPIVAVVSPSMEHNGLGFDSWWEENSKWYDDNSISKETFEKFSFKNGFNKGDIMILKGMKPEEVEPGDVIVFISHRVRPKADPIIHRTMRVWEQDGKRFYQTKGDNNIGIINACDAMGCVDETNISQDQLIGKAVFKIPLLGYIKIIFVDIVNFFVLGFSKVF